VASHLSEKNNSPDKVVAVIEDVAPTLTQLLHIAKQDEPSPWFELG
jgi:hypothetical protein